MLATGGSRARGPRRGGRTPAGTPVRRLAAAIAAAAALLALASGPAMAAPIAPTAAAEGARLAVIVPITSPAETVGLIPPDLLDSFTAPGGLLSRQLDAVDGTGAVLAIDPMILASVRVLGTAAPTNARDWIARLDAMPNDRFALPYADADPTLFTQSDGAVPPAPIGFGFAIDPAAFAPTEPSPTATGTPTPAPEPTATADPDAPIAIPTTDEITAIAGAIPAIAWPRAGTVAAGDLERLGATTAVLSSGDVAGAASGLATVDGVRTLVVDPQLSAAVQAAATATDELSWASEVDSASALLDAAIAAQTTPTATVVVAIDRLAASDAPRLPATIAALTGGSVSIASLTSLEAGEAPAAELVPGGQDGARVAAIDARLVDEAALDRFASAVDDPAAVVDAARLATLALGSQAWVDRADWTTALADAGAAASALLVSVHVIESSFLFVADRSTLPVAIQNDGPRPVTVLVTADPRTGLLDLDPTPVEVVVPAGSQATAEFAATAVSNGAVTVTVTMTSPTGVPIGSPAVADVNVQAGWETPVIAAAAVAVALLLVFGIIRTVRRIRARSAQDEDDLPPSSPRGPQGASGVSPADPDQTDG